ncbi:U3 small nucleolar RNA-interacting protein 2 isoform X2 [Venturia canescens]|uniref:U3 small nucleolar RNA-interacting protein 2 isoform X2 n=1 Tax=Venturia canescens TaxID=32260 RepID=UPI001C9C6F3C|nr:U3 small nucleolar RNA-interacting protein 2 isoform X2 [Venturia canescens]
MSFFIRNSRGGAPKRKLNGHISNSMSDARVKKNKRKNFNPKDDESIASSDEEFAEERAEKEQNFSESSDEDQETAQEKRLRLAKKYLAEIEDEEKDRKEFEEGAVTKRLHEEYLEEKGRLRKLVAANYTGHTDLLEMRCKDHRDSITCLCLSSDGRFVYSGSKDGTLVKWSVIDRKKLKVLKGKRKSEEGIKDVRCITISTDGKFLVVGDGGAKSIKVLNPEDFQLIKELQGHRGPVTGLVFRRDTHTLYSASEDRSVKVWNLDDMAYVESLFGHQNSVTSIDALSRERAITSGGYDRTIRIWKIIEESQLIYNGHGGSIDVVKLINEENFLSCGDDGHLSVWGSLKKKPLCTVPEAHGKDESNGQPMWISSIATLLNTDLVASGSRDGVVRLWRCGDSFKSLTMLFEVKVIGFVNAMAFTPDGENLVVGVGQEHRMGRWWRIPEAKNRIVIVPLVRNKSNN